MAARYVGDKDYELKDHLGNVRVVVTDAKGSAVTGGSVVGLLADVSSYSDYYAFGMTMPGRNYSSDSYRYGFNGKENDTETGWQDYGMRMYNPALGRFFSRDPMTGSFPYYTPYQYAGNKPVYAIDLDGLEDVGYDYVNDPAIARAIVTSFYDIKHSIYNVCLIGVNAEYFCGDIKLEAGYAKDASGNEVLETEFRYVKKESAGKELLKTSFDIINVVGAGRLDPSDFITVKNPLGVTQFTSVVKSYVIAASTGVKKNFNLNGTWVSIQRNVKGMDYQSYLSGKPLKADNYIDEFKYNDVDFDGYSNGILFDAKDGYGGFFETTGRIKDWAVNAGVGQKFVNEANSQIAAANGNKLQWIFSDPTAGKNMRDFLKSQKVDVDKIEFKYVEKPTK